MCCQCHLHLSAAAPETCSVHILLSADLFLGIFVFRLLLPCSFHCGAVIISCQCKSTAVDISFFSWLFYDSVIKLGN